MDFSDSKYNRQQKRLLRFKTTLLIATLAAIAFSVIGYHSLSQKKATQQHLQAALFSPDQEVQLGAFPIPIPNLKYGFAIDTFIVTEGIIQNRQFLADILMPHKVSMADIEILVQNSKDVFDFRKLRVDKPYTILAADSTQKADYFIYEPDVFSYYVFDLKNYTAKKVEREIDVELKAASGIIESSLWNAMVNNGMDFELASKMEDALQWSVDFHHLQPGERFKLLYEQKYIEGDPVGIGNLHAAYYQTAENEFSAFYFETNDGEDGFYDENGNALTSSFLRAPVKYSRISSGFNPRRFHPILKRVRPHLGTDYAAPYGTPIVAVGNGVVTEARYGRGNGNFVRIKHDDVHQTQYLHMQKFAQGIRKGTQVKQGQVIGYVGSTGLATGPHVCFRFWKDGKAINHTKLKFRPNKPLDEVQMARFKETREGYLEQLGEVEFKTFEEKEDKENEENDKEIL